MKEINFDVLDVRPVLARGEEPFGSIMEAKARLKPGRVLRIIAPFEPVPLYAVFESEGYKVSSKQVKQAEWWIEFHPSGLVRDDSYSTGSIVMTKELDLRHLELSDFVQEAFEALRDLGRDEMLLLHTHFSPVSLFEQIEGDGFDYDCEEKTDNCWDIYLWRIGF